MSPCEISVGTFDVIELSLLADPENSEGEKAEEIDEELRSERGHGAEKIVFGTNGFAGRGAEFEEKQSHRNGEDAVAESGEALDGSACDGVVAWHGRKCSRGGDGHDGVRRGNGNGRSLAAFGMTACLG